MDEINVQGIWWLPSNNSVDVPEISSDPGLPDGVTAGELIYKPSRGGRLELIGGLSGITPHSDSTLAREDQIFGVTTDGKKITIENCEVTNITQSRSQSMGVTEAWYCGRVLKGVHTDSLEITTLKVQFEPLGDWANFTFSPPSFADESDSDYSMQTREVDADLEDIHIKIWASKQPSPHEFSTGPDLTQFKIKSEDRFGLDTGISYVTKLQNFLSLAVDDPVFPEKISTDNSEYRFRDIDIYYHMNLYEEYDYSQPLFHLPDINFEDSIRAWFQHAEQFEDIHGLYFGTEYRSSVLPHLQFLSLVISLETLHRRSFPDIPQMDDEDWEEYREEAIERIPESAAKERIAGLIRNIGNEPSLGDRLNAIGDKYEHIVDGIIDTDEVLREAKNKRHSLAHGLHTVQSEELYPIIPPLKAFVVVIMLEEIGLTDKQLKLGIIRLFSSGPVVADSS